MKRPVSSAYLIAIHVFLVIVLLNSDFIVRLSNKLGVGNHQTKSSELTAYYHRMLGYHERMDGNVPDGAVIFIGDSITQGLCVSEVALQSVNYGIGTDTTFAVEEIIEEVARKHDLSPVSICSGSRKREVCRVRALVAFLAFEHGGHKGREVARIAGSPGKRSAVCL